MRILGFSPWLAPSVGNSEQEFEVRSNCDQFLIIKLVHITCLDVYLFCNAFQIEDKMMSD